MLFLIFKVLLTFALELRGKAGPTVSLNEHLFRGRTRLGSPMIDQDEVLFYCQSISQTSLRRTFKCSPGETKENVEADGKKRDRRKQAGSRSHETWSAESRSRINTGAGQEWVQLAPFPDSCTIAAHPSYPFLVISAASHEVTKESICFAWELQGENVPSDPEGCCYRPQVGRFLPSPSQTWTDIAGTLGLRPSCASAGVVTATEPGDNWFWGSGQMMTPPYRNIGSHDWRQTGTWNKSTRLHEKKDWALVIN